MEVCVGQLTSVNVLVVYSLNTTVKLLEPKLRRISTISHQIVNDDLFMTPFKLTPNLNTILEQIETIDQFELVDVEYILALDFISCFARSPNLFIDFSHLDWARILFALLRYSLFPNTNRAYALSIVTWIRRRFDSCDSIYFIFWKFSIRYR